MITKRKLSRDCEKQIICIDQWPVKPFDLAHQPFNDICRNAAIFFIFTSQSSVKNKVKIFLVSPFRVMPKKFGGLRQKSCYKY